MRQATEGRAGTLRIGFGIASASDLLPQTILRFRKTYPGIEIQMRDMSTPAQTRALLEEQIDIGIIRLPVARPELSSLPLIRERLVVAVPRATPYRAKDGLACLRDKPFLLIARAASTTFYDHVLAVCRRAGMRREGREAPARRPTSRVDQSSSAMSAAARAAPSRSTGR